MKTGLFIVHGGSGARKRHAPGI